MSARVESQREDVASLFRKFGGDASEYREFAPVAGPAATTPVPAPVAPVAASTPIPAVEPTGVAPLAASSAAPRELDVIFHRLASMPLAGAPASGLMAVWRRST